MSSHYIPTIERKMRIKLYQCHENLFFHNGNSIVINYCALRLKIIEKKIKYLPDTLVNTIFDARSNDATLEFQNEFIFTKQTVIYKNTIQIFLAFIVLHFQNLSLCTLKI